MSISNFRVEPADFSVDIDDLRALREAVFMVEQNIPEATAFDGIDPLCHHVIARDNQHQAIGCGRLAPDGNISHMAVLENWRGNGVGKALLLTLIDKARKLELKEATLMAHINVIGFYIKLGFVEEGGVFLQANIPQQCMRLLLEPVIKLNRTSFPKRAALVEISEFTTLADTQSALLQLISRARRQICIYSPDLEPVLYGQADIVQALKQFAIASRGGNILIIVQDPLAVRSQPHPLIDLAQRLPSTFLLRTPVEAEDLQYPSAFLINDREGYLFRQRSSHYRGVWSPTMPSRNRQLYEQFDAIWQRCRPCTEFRVLGL